MIQSIFETFSVNLEKNLLFFIDLRAPNYKEDGDEKITFTNSKLMEEDYLLRWTNSEKGGKYLNWNNYFIEITDSINSTMEST